MNLARTLKCTLALLLLVSVSFTSASAQTADAASSPEQVIRDFYGWYVKTMDAGKDPFTDGRAQLQRYVTPRLLKQIDKARKAEEMGADPFLDAQDFDKDWAKNITVGTPAITGKTAKADVQLKGPEMGTHKLRVTLVQDGATWKVDKAEAQ